MANVKLSALPASLANLAASDGLVGYQSSGTSDVLFSRAQLGAGITGVPLTTGVTGVLPVANGGTNASSASVTAFNNITGYTASGATGTTSTNLVFSTSPTLITPVLGTPASGTATNLTGLPLTTGVTGVLPVANGGTNASSASITAFNNITGFTAAGSTGTTSTNLVFSTSPTLVTPVLGAFTATSGAIGGATLGSNAFAVTGLVNFASVGSAPAPSLSVGNQTTGLYSVSTTGLGLSVNGAVQLDYGITTTSYVSVPLGNFQIGKSSGSISSVLSVYNSSGNIIIQGYGGSPNQLGFANTTVFGWVSGSSIVTSLDTIMSRKAAANMQLGAADAAAPVAQTLSVQSVVAGTSNTSGAAWTLTGSQGTGTGVGGSLVLKTAPAGSTGTSQNALATALTITGAGSTILGNAALATSATDGFIYIATTAGTPTGVPTSATGRVAMAYDTTNHQFWIYDGGWLQPKTPAAAAIVTWQ